MHSTCLKRSVCCQERRHEIVPQKGLQYHVAMSHYSPILSFLRVSRSDKRNPASAPGFLLPQIQPSGGAREAESQRQSVGTRQNGLGGSRTPSWRDRLLAPSAHRRVSAPRCRSGLAHPQKESVVLPVARAAFGKAWTSIAGSATYENNTGNPCTLTSPCFQGGARQERRDRCKGVSTLGKSLADSGKDRAPFQGLDIDRGLFVFGPATPIALSWECCRG